MTPLSFANHPAACAGPYHGRSGARARILRIAFGLAAICMAPQALAACSGTITGQSRHYSVLISDGSCEFQEEMIQVWKDSTAPEPNQQAPFSKDCKWGKDGGLACRKSGKTVLAGTVYKMTRDTNPSCFGEAVGMRLTCVKGCARAPRYLYLSPYEC